LNGFKKYYIESNIEDILFRIKPAGVHTEMTILSSRLNVPWDRILLTWESVIKAYWHRCLDGTWNLNNGTISFVNLYLDGSWTLNGEYSLNGQKMIRSTKPDDILIGNPLYYNNRTYKKKVALQPHRKLYLDGRIGLNGKFNLSGETIGVKVGYSECGVTKRIKEELVGQSYLDGSWLLNNERKLDGKYTYYQTGVETYFVKEVE
jgi:hypothetical protein